jgi:uncharacterized protein YjdB
MKKTLLILSIICLFISCKKDPIEPIDLTIKSISLSNTKLELLLGGSNTITTTILPAEAASTPLFWSSSDSTIVKVDKAGRVEAVNLGDATITVKNADGKVSSTCTVVVKPIVVKGISLDKTALSLIVGTKDKLNVMFEPTNTTDQKIAWSTSNALIVKVDQSGNIEATGIGEASISATTADGAATAVCKIIVGLPALTGLNIDKKDVQLLVGASIQFTAIINPPNAKPEELVWSSSDNSIATVSSLGVATALKAGKTTIKVTNKAGTISATTDLTVLPLKVSQITLNKTAIGMLIGSSETISATVLPLNAENKVIIWKSSNTSIATVDNMGKITGISNGTAVITATPADGSGVVSSCVIEVTTIDKLIKVAAKPNSLVFSAAGNSSRLSAGIYNGTSSPIILKFLKIYVNNILSINYTVTDPALSSGSYVYDLGPFALNSGAFDLSTLMVGWSVKFEYEHQGIMYSNTVAVKSSPIGQVNSNDFSSAASRSQNKPITISVRNRASLSSM